MESQDFPFRAKITPIFYMGGSTKQTDFIWKEYGFQISRGDMFQRWQQPACEEVKWTGIICESWCEKDIPHHDSLY